MFQVLVIRLIFLEMNSLKISYFILSFKHQTAEETFGNHRNHQRI